MIKIFIPARHQEPSQMHIFNHDESGIHPHRLDICPCDPVVEPLNVGEGYIIVHRSMDRVELGVKHPPRPDTGSVPRERR